MVSRQDLLVKPALTVPLMNFETRSPGKSLVAALADIPIWLMLSTLVITQSVLMGEGCVALVTFEFLIRFSVAFACLQMAPQGPMR